MSDGLVLEKGTHSDLLRNENGLYSRLVSAQKLRDRHGTETRDSDGTTAVSSAPEGMKQMVEEDTTCKDIGQPPESKVNKSKEPASEKEEGYHLSYIFFRMIKLNRANWLKYYCGTMAASSEFYFLCYISSS